MDNEELRYFPYFSDQISKYEQKRGNSPFLLVFKRLR